MLGVLSACSLIVFLLLSSIDMNCFHIGFFSQQYQELQTAQRLRMSEEDLMKSTQTLLDYLRGDADSIDVSIRVDGKERMAFNERESAHMVDVRSLYQGAMCVRWCALGVFIITTAALIALRRRAFLDDLSRGFLFVSFLFLFFLALLGIWIYADFTGFWTTFHRLFFTNDLWLLNPATDLMINLFPEAFFNHLVLRIILWFLAFYVPCLLVALYNRRQSIQMYFFPQTLTAREKGAEAKDVQGKPVETCGDTEEGK